MWFIILAVLLLLLTPAVRLQHERRVMRLWVTLLGVWMTTGSFVLLPWVAFSPWRYAQSLTLNVAAEAALVAIEQAEKLGLPVFLKFISKITALSGPMILWAMPSLNFVVRLVLLGVALAGLLSLIFIISGCVLHRQNVRRILGVCQSGTAFASLVALVCNLNVLDSWGAVGNFPFNLIPVIVGSEIGAGAWVAVVGLVVLIAGGLWTIADAESMKPIDEAWEDERDVYG